MESAAAKTMLSVLAMLYGWLQEGLGRLEQKDCPAAIAAFTKVVEHAQTDVDLRERALLWRGIAHCRAGALEQARADLGTLLSRRHGR